MDKTCLLLDELVASLAEVGLTFNVKKRRILTTQAQPPKQLRTRGGVAVDVLDRASPHKWLGCSILEGTIMQTLISIFKRLHGHFMQTDGS